LWLFIVVGLNAAPDFDAMQAAFVSRWTGADLSKFRAWRELIASGQGVAEAERLKRVNDFFNRNIIFGDDMTVWGQLDYWATPLETLGRGAGDCEDFVIAKFYTLRLMGVSVEKLRLIYVQAHTGISAVTPTQAHMVLAFYPAPDAEPLVLDNLIGEIRLASRRTDLSPVFSFNEQGIFAGASGSMLAPAVGAGRLSRWEDLLKRARAEGFE
jgi:predicted transglutaminase-like cysteine proteinase